MSVYDEHKRLLDLVLEQAWTRLDHEDKPLLQSLMYAGYVTAQLLSGSPKARTQLVLTPRGRQYLSELQEQSEQVRIGQPYGRRSTDRPRGSPEGG